MENDYFFTQSYYSINQSDRVYFDSLQIEISHVTEQIKWMTPIKIS